MPLLNLTLNALHSRPGLHHPHPEDGKYPDHYGWRGPAAAVSPTAVAHKDPLIAGLLKAGRGETIAPLQIFENHFVKRTLLTSKAKIQH